MRPMSSVGLGVAAFGTTAETRNNNRNSNIIRPKKKLTRLSKGLDPEVYRNLWFPQQSVARARKTTNLIIPKIVIDKAKDEDSSLDTRESHFMKHEINAALLHPAYTLSSAVSADDPTGLKSIILSGVADVNQLNFSGVSALHDAAFEGKLDCVEILVQLGADVDLRDREGWNPLHAAVFGGSPPCAAFLIKYGADVSARNDDGLTPVEMAVVHKDREMIKILTSSKNYRYYGQRREFQLNPVFPEGKLRLANYGRV